MNVKKPLQMYVYQPLWAKINSAEEGEEINLVETYVKCAKLTAEYRPLKRGDLFTMEKRPAKFHELADQSMTKVNQVVHNFNDGSVNVILSKMAFDTIEELNEFCKGKSTCM